MRKGRDVTRLPVLTFDTGEKVGEAKELLFDPENNRVLGLLIDEGGWFKERRVVPFGEIKSIGPDGVIIPSADVIVSAKGNEELSKAMETNRIIAGARVFTESGKDLGQIADIVFDEATGQIAGYDVSGGFLADRFRGQPFMPAPETIRVGKRMVYVPDATAEKMEEQVGGVAGVVGRVRERGEELGDRFATMSKDQQKRYIVGKTSPVDFFDSTGQPIVVKGQTITEEAAGKADQEGKLGELASAVGRGQVVAAGGSLREQMTSLYETVSARLGEATSQFQERQLESVKGRTSSRDVRADDGTLIIAKGQIVTQDVVDAAKRHDKANALLAAVGLGRVQELVESARRRTLEIFGETSREVEKEETLEETKAPEAPTAPREEVEAKEEPVTPAVEEPESYLQRPSQSGGSEPAEGAGMTTGVEEHTGAEGETSLADKGDSSYLQ